MKKVRKCCPLCGLEYNSFNPKTKHHIFFPRRLYAEEENVTVEVCIICHQKEFHEKLYRMSGRLWSKEKCLRLWISFCRIHKGVNALKIYPQLKAFL